MNVWNWRKAAVRRKSGIPNSPLRQGRRSATFGRSIPAYNCLQCGDESVGGEPCFLLVTTSTYQPILISIAHNIDVTSQAARPAPFGSASFSSLV